MPTLAEDRASICDLLARYCHDFDRGNADGVADLFTEDGVFDPDVAGFEAVEGRDVIRGFVGSMPAGMVHHMTTDAAYDVDGDVATGIASFLVVAKGAVVTVGRYHDDLARVDGAWRIRRRVAVADAAA
jgi:ketosteroid isomerase-like protein